VPIDNRWRSLAEKALLWLPRIVFRRGIPTPINRVNERRTNCAFVILASVAYSPKLRFVVMTIRCDGWPLFSS
jgi:hypothetical protein